MDNRPIYISHQSCYPVLIGTLTCTIEVMLYFIHFAITICQSPYIHFCETEHFFSMSKITSTNMLSCCAVKILGLPSCFSTPCPSLTFTRWPAMSATERWTFLMQTSLTSYTSLHTLQPFANCPNAHCPRKSIYLFFYCILECIIVVCKSIVNIWIPYTILVWHCIAYIVLMCR